MRPAAAGSTLEGSELATWLGAEMGTATLEAALREEIAPAVGWDAGVAHRGHLHEGPRRRGCAGCSPRSMRCATARRFAELEILVVDNASVDASTREAVAAVPAVRYVHEARTGLDFARNAALREARGRLLAFLDDDVVVDPHWLDGLHTVSSACPDAGG